MNLSEHFALEEFLRSKKAEELGLGNEPDIAEIMRMRLLCVHCLEILREAVGKPVNIDSGFRSEALNNAIGGVKDSQHRLGEAADIKIDRMTPEEIVQVLIDKNIPFDEAIAEHDFDANDHWTHISYTERRPLRRKIQTMIQVGGVKTYSPFINNQIT